MKSTNKISTRIVGWSAIARRAKCDRNTLKHSDRLSWVEKRRNQLLEKINKKQIKVSGNNIQLVKDDQNDLEITKEKLKLSKDEPAKWFIKYQELQHELKMTREALQRQMETNSWLTNDIIHLKSQIKQLVANNAT